MKKQCNESKEAFLMTKKIMPIFMFLAILGFNSAHADLIDLNLPNFFADPTVTVSPDGSTAEFTEDSFLLSVLLSNNPAGFGDPVVIFSKDGGGIGQILSFDYNFQEIDSDLTDFFDVDDQFDAAVLDNTGTPITGFTVTAQSSTPGPVSVSFDLTSLDGSEPLGLQFSLTAWDSDIGSTLTISNVRLTPVPVPGAVLLAGLGLGTSAFGILRKKRKL